MIGRKEELTRPYYYNIVILSHDELQGTYPYHIL